MHTNSIYQVAVIGDGPSGLAAISELLGKGIKQIVWIGKEFKAGRLNHYRQVPSNTKVCLFLKYAERICKGAALPFDGKITELFKDLDPNGHCLLSCAADMVTLLSDRLRKPNESVQSIKEFAEKVVFKDLWSIHLSNQQIVQARAVILAVGSHPKAGFIHHRSVVDVDTALCKDRLVGIINKSDKIAVFGNSHSAMLIIKNLKEIGANPTCIYKHPPLYALYGVGNQIIYDNTGLKGVAAEWTRQHWAGLQKIRFHQEMKVDDFDHAIFATGFERNSTLQIEHENNVLKAGDLIKENGHLLDGQHHVIPGLFGVGIAFPGKDTYEHEGQMIVEDSVGLFKFCRHCEKEVSIILSYLQK